MLRLKRRTAAVAAGSLFAALYAILGALPVSKILLGSGNFLTASNFVTPLAGMLFGPFVGGFAAVVGDLLDAYAGYIVIGSTGLSIIAADLATVATAGLAYTGRWRAAIAVPVVVLLLYWADPISVLFVGPVPFTWLHMLSVPPLIVVLLFQKSGRLSRLNPVFVAAVTFASLLCGQLTGTLVGQELAVRVYQTLSLQAWQGIVPLFFPLYPVERTLFTVVGSAVSIPILRAVWRREHPHSQG
ncbi:MAG: hypothetical protein KGI26_06445 [Thaumarchaeota archaeon]|nr:hypothetical protein [Nitrososphaerota archaeon]